jgi:hypothetical protein
LSALLHKIHETDPETEDLPSSHLRQAYHVMHQVQHQVQHQDPSSHRPILEADAIAPNKVKDKDGERDRENKAENRIENER